MSEIMAYKLINNMDVIAKKISEEDTFFNVQSPLLAMMQHGQNPGEVSIEFGPLSPLMNMEGDRIQKIYKSSIISEYKPISQIENMYIEQTSGIQIVGSGDIATPSVRSSRTQKNSSRGHKIAIS
jgi:hypothetical protein